MVYRNRSNVSVINPVFRINLTGSALEEGSILPYEGFYNSAQNEMIWDKDINPGLSVIPAGKEGRLAFTFRVLPRNIDAPVVVKEPVVNLSLSFSGIRDDGSNAIQNLENIENGAVRVTTEPSIKIETIFASGELPPKLKKKQFIKLIYL